MVKGSAVFGLGNILMSDEGIGCRIVERLLGQKDSAGFADFIEIGTKGMSLFHLLGDYKKAVIVDCALMDTEPGTIKRFTPDDVNSVKKLAHYSLHEADVLGIIEMSRKLGQSPQEIVIFGIEPQIVEPGQRLSSTLSQHLDSYTQTILDEIRG
ncbi:MAG: hydrogenase maturation protease [Phycisphaerae bacterium]